jgi:hypothetical protein
MATGAVGEPGQDTIGVADQAKVSNPQHGMFLPHMCPLGCTVSAVIDRFSDTGSRRPAHHSRDGERLTARPTVATTIVATLGDGTAAEA